MNDTRILELALDCMAKSLDEFITKCRADDGPTAQDIARARALLPEGYVNSYPSKKRNEVRAEQINEQLRARVASVKENP